MVYDKTKMQDKQAQAQNAVKAAIAHPSVSAMVYGYLKEKEMFKDLTVEQWKEMEKDIVEIILAEIYPGEEISEDQLTFSAIANSFAFMSRFIETLNAQLEASGEAGKDEEEEKGGFELQ